MYYRIIISFIILLTYFSVPSFANHKQKIIDSNHWEYILGRGLKFGNSDIFLGGYLSFKFLTFQDNNGRFVVDNISTFIFGNLNKNLSFFSEMEYADLWEINLKGEHKKNNIGEIERLHFDYFFNDALKIRV